MKTTKQVATSIPTDYAIQLELFCEQQDRSIAWYIKRVLIAALKRDGIVPKRHQRNTPITE